MFGLFGKKGKKKRKQKRYSTSAIDTKPLKRWNSQDVQEWVGTHGYQKEAAEYIKNYLVKENVLGCDLLHLTPTDLKVNLKGLQKHDIFKFHVLLQHLQHTKRYDRNWTTIFSKLYKVSPDDVETVRNFTNILSDREMFYEKYFSFYVDYFEMKELEIRSKLLDRDPKNKKKVAGFKKLAAKKKERLQMKYEELTREKYIDVNFVGLCGAKFHNQTDNEQWAIPCKIIITEIYDEKDSMKKNLRSFISPLVTKLPKFKKSTRFGLFHTALTIGPFYLEWRNHEIIVPKKYFGSKNALISHDVPSVSTIAHRDIKKMVQTIVDVVYIWNCRMYYSQKREEYGGNCQDFVDEILVALGVDTKQLFQGMLGNFIKRLRSNGRADLEFHPSENYTKIMKHPEKKKIVFKTHKELDQYTKYCMDQVVNMKEEYANEFFLLKSFDRAFWLRHLRNPTDPVYHPVPMSKTSSGCPYGDPRQTMSFLPY